MVASACAPLVSDSVVSTRARHADRVLRGHGEREGSPAEENTLVEQLNALRPFECLSLPDLVDH
jgi:hypothetical protein